MGHIFECTRKSLRSAVKHLPPVLSLINQRYVLQKGVYYGFPFYIFLSVYTICMYVCKHACMGVRPYVCMYVCMYACMYVCMHVIMYICVCLHSRKRTGGCFRCILSFSVSPQSSLAAESSSLSCQHHTDMQSSQDFVCCCSVCYRGYVPLLQMRTVLICVILVCRLCSYGPEEWYCRH